MFSDSDLAARANQAFPIVRLAGKLARQQNFDASPKKIKGSGIVRRLRPRASAASIKARTHDAGVVENHHIAGPQELGKIPEHPVAAVPGGSLKMQHPRRIAGYGRFLGDQFFGELEIEIRDQHLFRI
jgi:hypothetical protein